MRGARADLRVWGVALTALLGGGQVRTSTMGGDPVAQIALRPLERGVNIDGWFDLRGATVQQMRSFIGDSEPPMLRRMGFDFVRVPVTPYLLGDPGRSVDSLRLRLVLRGVEQFRRAGMAVIVDVHPAPAEIRQFLATAAGVDRLCRFLGRLGSALRASDPSMLGLELLNEPTNPDPTQPGWNWNAVQDRLVKCARRALPAHTLISGADMKSHVQGFKTLKPSPDLNVMYDFHFYEPQIFTAQGARWLADSVYHYARDLPYPSSPESVAQVAPRVLASVPSSIRSAEETALAQYGDRHWGRALIKQRVALVAAWARAQDRKVIVGEFGVYRPHASAGARARWLEDCRTTFEEAGFPWAVWEYKRGFGLFDARGVVDTAAVRALGLRMPDGSAP